MFKRSLRVRKTGFKQYPGSAKEILQQIISACYNKEKGYFQVSTGHFCEFYTRDFGWCAESLLKLGYKKEAISTLHYALEIFRKHGKVTVAISPDGVPFDFPYYGADSMPYLIHALRLANDKKLVSEFKEFLQQQTIVYFSKVIDPATGMVRKDGVFSSMKDHAKRSSSCYDTCMAGMLKNDLAVLKLDNPLKNYDYEKIIIENFWTGSYFLDDLSGSRHIAGDANLFPFYCGIIKEREIMRKAFAALERNGLTEPSPLRYTHSPIQQKMNYMHLLMKDYELSSVWMHMGPLYLALLKTVDKIKYDIYLNRYIHLIEHFKNFFELYTPEGKPYKAWCYAADEGMLWAVNVLSLIYRH